jgi:lipoyl-dependent peroxiredoxin
MTDRTAATVWTGTLLEGSGTVTFESSGLVRDAAVSWPARAEEPGDKTSPEELIAAAHSSCYSMALSKQLAERGTPAERLETSVTVTFVPGTGITRSAITVRVSAPGLDDAGWRRRPPRPRRAARCPRRWRTASRSPWMRPSPEVAR